MSQNSDGWLRRKSRDDQTQSKWVPERIAIILCLDCL